MPRRALAEKRPLLLASIAAALAFYYLRWGPWPELYLIPLKGAAVECGPTDRILRSGLDETFDLVVLDPPREGAKRAVVEQVVDRRPRAVAYVACDPAALGRDVAIFAEHGYELTAIRAFDLFPMTHHVECVALLEPVRR